MEDWKERHFDDLALAWQKLPEPLKTHVQLRYKDICTGMCDRNAIIQAFTEFEVFGPEKTILDDTEYKEIMAAQETYAVSTQEE